MSWNSQSEGVDLLEGSLHVLSAMGVQNTVRRKDETDSDNIDSPLLRILTRAVS